MAARAQSLASRIPGATTEPGTSSVGGGSFPDADLPTTLVSVATDHPDAFLADLRTQTLPVIARADNGRVLLDPRTIHDRDVDDVVAAVVSAQNR